MTESTAIQQLSLNCKKSFRFLYDQYHAKVFKVAFSLGMDQEESLELVQDVFVTIWEKRRLMANVKSFEAYLIAVTKNTSFKKLRKKAHNHAHLTYFTPENSSVIAPKIQLEEDEVVLLSQAALNKLSPQQREIFELFAHENMSQQQIAEQMNISVRTVENQIYQAKKKLKAFLNFRIISISLVLLSVTYFLFL